MLKPRRAAPAPGLPLRELEKAFDIISKKHPASFEAGCFFAGSGQLAPFPSADLHLVACRFVPTLLTVIDEPRLDKTDSEDQPSRKEREEQT